MTLKERPTVTPIVTSPEPEVQSESPVPSAPKMVDSDSVEYEGKVYSRAGNAAFWTALDFLRQNPDARALSVRKLADATGVSKGHDAPPKP